MSELITYYKCKECGKTHAHQQGQPVMCPNKKDKKN